jgi:hypothetical protein
VGYNLQKITIDGTVRSFNSEIKSFIKASILRKLKAVETSLRGWMYRYYNENRKTSL